MTNKKQKQEQFYMTPDGSVLSESDYKWLEKHMNKDRKKPNDLAGLGYEKAWKVTNGNT